MSCTIADQDNRLNTTFLGATAAPDTANEEDPFQGKGPDLFGREYLCHDKMKEVAQDNSGENASHAILTAPTYFNDEQRQAYETPQVLPV